MFITFQEMFSPEVNIDIHCEKIEVLQEKKLFSNTEKMSIWTVAFDAECWSHQWSSPEENRQDEKNYLYLEA